MKRKVKRPFQAVTATHSASNLQSKATKDNRRWLTAPWSWIFPVLTAILLPTIFAYWQIAEPHLASVGPPVAETGRADPRPGSVTILTTVKERVRNRGWRAGHVDHVEIRPLKFDQPVEVEIRYVDRRPILPFQEKLLTFQFIQTVRHTGDNMFVVTVIDNNGKEVEEFQSGNKMWRTRESPPPETTKPTSPD
jgi:hypothetical protein